MEVNAFVRGARGHALQHVRADVLVGLEAIYTRHAKHNNNIAPARTRDEKTDVPNSCRSTPVCLDTFSDSQPLIYTKFASTEHRSEDGHTSDVVQPRLTPEARMQLIRVSLSNSYVVNSFLAPVFAK
jgi:hypothetical protein